MRKALIGLILAATAISPVAAEAQRGRGHDGGEQRSFRGDRGGGQRGDRGGQRQAQQQQQAPQQTQAPAQPQPPQTVQVAQRRGDGNRGGRGGRGDRGPRQPSIYPQAWQGNPNSPDLRRYQRLEQQNQARYGRRGDRDRDGDRDRNWRGGDRDRDGDRNWRGGDRNRDGDRGRNWRGDNRRNWAGDWNRGWRNDRRYDWNGWRYRNRNIFHLSPYYSPYRNWRYRRFSIGLFLEPLFFSQNYWIGDPWQYRLPPAPPGTRWVRYYDDVLLVDTYSGEVVDVIYDFFW